MYHRLAKLKPSNISAVLTAIFHVVTFFALLLLYLAFDDSQAVMLFGIFVGFPVFYLTSFFFIFGVSAPVFKKATFIRMLSWAITGGILVNIIALLAKYVG